MSTNDNYQQVFTEVVKRLDEKFDLLNTKVDTIIEIDRVRNGKWDAHLVSEQQTKSLVESHEREIKKIDSLKKTAYGTLITVILSLFGAVAYYNYGYGKVVGMVEANYEAQKEWKATIQQKIS